MRLAQGHVLIVKEPGSELISVDPEVWAQPGPQGLVNHPTQQSSHNAISIGMQALLPPSPWPFLRLLIFLLGGPFLMFVLDFVSLRP